MSLQESSELMRQTKAYSAVKARLWGGITQGVKANARINIPIRNPTVEIRNPYDVIVSLAPAICPDQNGKQVEDKYPTLDHIIRYVGFHYGISLCDLKSHRRTADVARPRQVAMYLCRELTPRSFPVIGKKLGGKDHTTVIHAWKRVIKLMSEDSQFAAEIEYLKQRITSA